MLDWARGLGQVAAFGVEGTGCDGAGLARFLGAQGQVVVEVNRPDRQARRRRGKSDPVDAEAAARAVLAGQATAIPKTGDSMIEMVRWLRVARATAIKARTRPPMRCRRCWSPPLWSGASSCAILTPASLPPRRRGCAQGRS